MLTAPLQPDGKVDGASPLLNITPRRAVMQQAHVFQQSHQPMLNGAVSV